MVSILEDYSTHFVNFVAQEYGQMELQDVYRVLQSVVVLVLLVQVLVLHLLGRLPRFEKLILCINEVELGRILELELQK